MIKVTIGSNTNRKQVTVDPSRTLKDVLDENGIDYSRGGLYLEGLSVGGSDLNKSFTEHGIDEECMLISVVKGDGGLY